MLKEHLVLRNGADYRGLTGSPLDGWGVTQKSYFCAQRSICGENPVDSFPFVPTTLLSMTDVLIGTFITTWKPPSQRKPTDYSTHLGLF